jgi:heptose I phosphotransferase
MKLFVEKDFLKTLPSTKPPFDTILNIQGKLFRQLEGRETLAFVHDDKRYFIKKHFGIGWKEIFKNLLQKRLPVISAKNEWEALMKLNKLGIHVPRVIAYGERGFNPAKKTSFVLMEEVESSVSLEDYCRDWYKYTPNPEIKKTLIKEVARMLRIMHTNGINHRDCYICHFLLKTNTDELSLYLIDLHRAQMRKEVPMRWLIKDLAGMYFSSMNIGLTKDDIIFFLEEYFQLPWFQIQAKHKKLLEAIDKKAHALYKREYGKLPPQIKG